MKKGTMSPAKQYRKPGKTSYGGGANVRESMSKTFSKAEKSSSKKGMYDKYS